MLPLEFVATPEASPRCMSGGSLMKLGTESNWSSGADVDCANADVLSRPNSRVSQCFMNTSLGVAAFWDELPPAVQYTNRSTCNTIAQETPEDTRKTAMRMGTDRRDFGVVGFRPPGCAGRPRRRVLAVRKAAGRALRDGGNHTAPTAWNFR